MTAHVPAAEQPASSSIETLACSIQAMPAHLRWLHARPDVICALAIGATTQRGPRTQTLARLLGVAGMAGLAGLACRCISFALLVRTFLRQPSGRLRGGTPDTIFVGVGALREGALVNELREERGSSVLELNETDTRNFAAYHRVPLGEFVRTWLRISRTVAPELRARQSTGGIPVCERRIAFVTEAHRYAFFHVFFRKAALQGNLNQPVIFTASGTAASAAIAAGLHAAFYAHGFLRRSLVFADFEQVRCFNRCEVGHIAKRLPAAQIRVCEEPANLITSDRVVAIAGCYGQTGGFEHCAAIVEWAADNKIPVIVRKHPLDSSGYFERWRSVPNVTLLDTSEPFDEFLESRRPRMVVSWYSTALFDALRRGVVPITVAPEVWRSADVIFPFREISLTLPDDRSRMIELFSSDSARHDWLCRKRELAGLGSGAD